MPAVVSPGAGAGAGRGGCHPAGQQRPSVWAPPSAPAPRRASYAKTLSVQVWGVHSQTPTTLLASHLALRLPVLSACPSRHVFPAVGPCVLKVPSNLLPLCSSDFSTVPAASRRAWGLDTVVPLVRLPCLLRRRKPGPHPGLRGLSPSPRRLPLPGPRRPEPALRAAALPDTAGRLLLGPLGAMLPQLRPGSGLPLCVLPLPAGRGRPHLQRHLPTPGHPGLLRRALPG